MLNEEQVDPCNNYWYILDNVGQVDLYHTRRLLELGHRQGGFEIKFVERTVVAVGGEDVITIPVITAGEGLWLLMEETM